jgi:hypothetical protein
MCCSFFWRKWWWKEFFRKYEFHILWPAIIKKPEFKTVDKLLSTKGEKKNKPEGHNIIIKTKNHKFSWDLFIMSVDCSSSFWAFFTVIPIQLQQLMHYIFSNRCLQSMFGVKHFREVAALRNTNRSCSPSCHAASQLHAVSLHEGMS